MMNTSHTSSSLLLVFLLCTSLAAQTDRVRTRLGSEAGEVVAMSPLEVTLDSSGRQQKIAVSDIHSIQFGEEPAELTQARSNALSGAYEKALEMIGGIDVVQLRDDYVKQEVEYYTAYCNTKLALLGGGAVADAGKQLNAFVSANGDSFHRLEAEELLGDLLAALGNYRAAQRKYEVLAKTPWASYKIRSAVLVGKALQAQDMHDEAVAKFDQALAISDDSTQAESQRQAAQLAKGVSLSASGKVDEGAALVRSVISNASPEAGDLVAQAYNALGGCYLKAGRAKDALFAYLHVDLLYPTQPKAHAEALYHLSSLWKEVGKSGEARQARQTLESQYAETSWARK